MTLSIANGAGFLGDDLAAPRRLVEAAEVDFLTLEYLAESTMSILARQREKDPRGGFASDWLEVLRSLQSALAAQPQLRIVTNAGGVNPGECVQQTAKLLVQAGMANARVARVDGDDLLPQIAALQQQGCEFVNLETGEPLRQLKARVISANAYLGARPIAAALDDEARLVITGRVADASLTVGPAMHSFGWEWDDWQKLAAATLAGHLIECGSQVTGGYSTSWQNFDLAAVGYPIAELSSAGEAVITKPAASGGAVTRQTVAEQLVYEIGDPARYLTPDVTASFQNVVLEPTGVDRVLVRGAAGQPATDTYKVSLAYQDGYQASGQLLVWGRDSVAKARSCAGLILGRVELAGFQLARTHVELLGTGEAMPGVAAGQADEVLLRIAVHDPLREAVERFVREFAPLITSGPAGLAGYASGRPPVRSVYSYWPTLVPKSLVQAKVEVRTAAEWISQDGGGKR